MKRSIKDKTVPRSSVQFPPMHHIVLPALHLAQCHAEHVYVEVSPIKLNEACALVSGLRHSALMA